MFNLRYVAHDDDERLGVGVEVAVVAGGGLHVADPGGVDTRFDRSVGFERQAHHFSFCSLYALCHRVVINHFHMVAFNDTCQEHEVAATA